MTSADQAAMAAKITNPVSDRIARGEVAFGINVRLSHSGEIATIAAGTGHDFLYIDAQHALFSLETIGHISQTAIAHGVAPMVRVRSVDDPNISVMLDNGVLGIVAPNVESAAEAQRVVNAAKFPPVGKRSIGGWSVHAKYQPMAAGPLVELFDRVTMVICMIESRAGLEKLDEIAAVPGVDGLYMGMSDMLVSMGKPGAFGDPEVMDGLDRVLAAAKRHGQFVGAGGVGGLDIQAEVIRRGVRFMTTQSDLGLVANGAANAIAQLRGAIAGNGQPAE